MVAARKASAKPKEAAPPVQVAQLERALAGDAPLARGYLVRGEERWFRDAAVSILVAAAERRGLEIVRHDGADPDFDLGALQGDLAAAPMFAAARLIVVRSLPALLKKEDPGVETAASRFLGDRSVPGALVLEAESLRVDSVLATAVTAAGGTILSLRRLWDTPPPWAPDPAGSELVQWLLARAKQKKVRLDPREAVYVATATGNELAALDQVLDDLARRGKESVKALVGSTAAVSPFQVSEDLLRGDPAASIAGIEGLFRSGMRTKEGAREVKLEANLAVLLQSLRAKVRATLALARAQAAGAPPPPGLMKAAKRTVEELFERVPLRPPRDWARMSDELAEIERRTRTSRTVDANDLARLALRWRRETTKTSPPRFHGSPYTR